MRASHRAVAAAAAVALSLTALAAAVPAGPGGRRRARRGRAVRAGRAGRHGDRRTGTEVAAGCRPTRAGAAAAALAHAGDRGAARRDRPSAGHRGRPHRPPAQRRRPGRGGAAARARSVVHIGSGHGAAGTFVNRYGQAFGLRPGQQARPRGIEALPGGDRTVRFGQHIAGVPVLGGELVVTVNRGGDVVGAVAETPVGPPPPPGPRCRPAPPAAGRSRPRPGDWGWRRVRS